MASISTGKDGRKQLQFVALDGKRKSLYLGEVSKEFARDMGKHIDHLVRCRRTDEEPKKATQAWIRDILPSWKNVSAKLSELDILITDHKPDEVFADFVEHYISTRRDVKPGTIKTWSQASQKVRTFFGRRSIKSLTKADGKDFLRWLKTPKEQGGAGHKGETPSKHLGHVRGFLNEAVDAEVIPVNPFRKVTAQRTPQTGRKRMINTQDVLRVIEVAPDAEMKAIIALSFWGGLRTPSEHYVLKWSAIRWDENMMTVLAPKTEGKGKASRETPLFPELLPYLLDLHEVSEHTGPDDFVIQKRRTQTEANLRGRMYRLCIKAGVEKWPKIFQNLRSTRQTILEQHYPRGTVCEWMGNTEDVAEAHYIQEQKEFREVAAMKPTTETEVTAEHQGDTKSTTDKKRQKVVQNVVQKSEELARTRKKASILRTRQNSPKR